MVEPSGTTGYMGRLTPEEQKTLATFKQLINKFAAEKWKYSLAPFNDFDYLRFLRARKFDLKKSLLMFDKYITWRINSDVDKVYVLSWHITAIMDRHTSSRSIRLL